MILNYLRAAQSGNCAIGNINTIFLHPGEGDVRPRPEKGVTGARDQFQAALAGIGWPSRAWWTGATAGPVRGTSDTYAKFVSLLVVLWPLDGVDKLKILKGDW